MFCEKGLRTATLLKKKLWHRHFPVNFVKFLRTPFLAKHLWWLLLAIPGQVIPLSRTFLLFRVGCAIPSRRFLLFRVGYIWSKTFALCCSQQVILSRTFLIFLVGCSKNVYTEQKFSAILCSLNQSEHFDDPKKVIQSRNVLFFLLVLVGLQAHNYSEQTCAPMFLRLAVIASERQGKCQITSVIARNFRYCKLWIKTTQHQVNQREFTSLIEVKFLNLKYLNETR